VAIRRWLWVTALAASGVGCFVSCQPGGVAPPVCFCGDGTQQGDHGGEGTGCAGSPPSCDCICGAHGGACNSDFLPYCVCNGSPGTGPGTFSPFADCVVSVATCQLDCTGDAGSNTCRVGRNYATAQMDLPDGGSTICFCNGCGCFMSPNPDGGGPACP
jgi:hypothetical protein